ncbi:cyclin-l2 isoform 1 [Diplodia corticola]|uniref:RNA polymerase II holoenzyme cyclin-like subunit n=1 Tax=Diplodia corticola TaxID=236234 RepID=A0A1J9R6T5_9PEZI|nr:cyclin-l2 isoform 1 [Diplodia corticola]OJD35938.1 cyclin-l2 isoform 1 [Diplodia corticola]
MAQTTEEMQNKGETSVAGPSMDAISMITLLADILRLPEECLAMSFVFLNRYQKFQRQQKSSLGLDNHMLALACLSVASKAKDAPRRVREFLRPAWRLMHQAPDSAALECPSPAYDSLRSTLVRNELILLRILKFELRVSTPFDFLPGYLTEAMRDFGVNDGGADALVYFDDRSKEDKEADRIADLMETGIAKDCRAKALGACKDYQLANFFPAKAVTAACIYIVLRDRGLLPGIDMKRWLRDKVSRSIELEDFEDAVSSMDKR